MAEPYDDVPDAAASPYAAVQAPLEIGDQGKADAYRLSHAASGRSAGDRYEQIMQQRQAAVEETRATLAKTIDDLKARHEGTGFGQINIPLMSFAAGLLAPTRTHNFGEELSHGLQGLSGAVTQQRMSDTDYMEKIAKLQQTQGQLSDIPLRDAAANARAQQLQEEKNVNAIDVAGIRGSKPIVNAQTGVTLLPNYFGAGRHGMMKPGSTDVVPIGAAAPGAASAAAAPTSPEDDIKFLQQTVSPDIQPGTMVNDIKYDKLAKIAREDPGLAGDLWDLINYNQDMKSITATRGAKTEARELYRQAREIDPTFVPAQFSNVQKARQDWEGTGKMMQNTVQLQKTLNHMGDALGAAAALQNGDNQAINVVKNKIAEWSGSAGPTNVRTVADILSKEMAKYFAGAQGGGTGEERKDLSNMLATAKSPQQLQGAIRYAMSLVRGQAEPLAHAKTQAFGNRKKYGMEDLLDPSSRESYKSIMENDITTPEGSKALLARLPPVTNPKAQSFPTPSAAAIERLKSVKDVDVFENHFGPGSAKKYLGE